MRDPNRLHPNATRIVKLTHDIRECDLGTHKREIVKTMNLIFGAANELANIHRKILLTIIGRWQQTIEFRLPCKERFATIKIAKTMAKNTEGYAIFSVRAVDREFDCNIEWRDPEESCANFSNAYFIFERESASLKMLSCTYYPTTRLARDTPGQTKPKR